MSIFSNFAFYKEFLLLFIESIIERSKSSLIPRMIIIFLGTFIPLFSARGGRHPNVLFIAIEDVSPHRL